LQNQLLYSWQKKVIFAYIDEPPFASPDVDGLAVGYDIELATRVLKSLGVKHIQTQLVTFGDLIPGVSAGNWTMNCAMFITPARSKLVHFSDPIWAVQDGFVVLAGNPKELSNYEEIARHPTARLGVVAGQVQEQSALQAGIPAERITIFPEQDDVINALLHGTVDAYASTSLGIRYYLKRLDSPFLQAVNFQPDEANTRQPIFLGGFSFAKSNDNFHQAFNMQLASFLGSEAHRDIMRKHGFTEVEIDPVLHRD
jgi:polar amino acid transport system substrate-binding protein